MKTKVIVHATISIEIDETWQDSAPISQINKDAMAKAQIRLHNHLDHKLFTLSEIKHIRTHLINEEQK